MAISFTAQDDGNLSQEQLDRIWNEPPEANNYLLTNDYISKSNNFVSLFANDVELQRQINIINVEIDGIKFRLDAVELLAASNELRLDALEPRVGKNETDIANNAAQIAQNITDIGQNASDIAAISTPSGTGTPENVVIATKTQLYIDTAGAPDIYFNPTIGSNTGWLLVSSSG